MRLDLLLKFYEARCEVRKICIGDMMARAEYHHKDSIYVGTNSANIWQLQDHEVTYFFSGDRLDMPAYRMNMESAIEELGDMLTPNRKLRSATLTLVMIYDSADQDVVDEAKAHDYRVYHKHSLNGWTIHRVALVLTDSGDIVTDKRASKLVRRLQNIASL